MLSLLLVDQLCCCCWRRCHHNRWKYLQLRNENGAKKAIGRLCKQRAFSEASPQNEGPCSLGTSLYLYATESVVVFTLSVVVTCKKYSSKVYFSFKSLAGPASFFPMFSWKSRLSLVLFSQSSTRLFSIACFWKRPFCSVSIQWSGQTCLR